LALARGLVRQLAATAGAIAFGASAAITGHPWGSQLLSAAAVVELALPAIIALVDSCGVSTRWH
jgi:hypothetical protein